MNYVTILLRLLHIFSAFVWFGVSATMTVYIVPALAVAGEPGLRYYRTLLTSNKTLALVFPVSAGLTTLAGILLYVVGGATSHFSSNGNVVLAIGAVAGLLAAVHGGTSLTKYTNDLAKTALTGDAAAVNEFQRRAALLVSHSRISFALMLVALVFMGSARYL